MMFGKLSITTMMAYALQSTSTGSSSSIFERIDNSHTFSTLGKYNVNKYARIHIMCTIQIFTIPINMSLLLIHISIKCYTGAAITAAGLEETLSGDGTFTVFGT